MGKLITSLSILGGIVFLFYLGGLIEPGIVTILDYLTSPQLFQSLTFGAKLSVVTLSVIAVSALVVALGNKADFVLVVPLVAVFLEFGWDTLQVYSVLSAQGAAAQIIAMSIMSPFLLMYVIGVVDWWRGTET